MGRLMYCTQNKLILHLSRLINGSSTLILNAFLQAMNSRNKGNQLILYFYNLFLDPLKGLLQSCEFSLSEKSALPCGNSLPRNYLNLHDDELNFSLLILQTDGLTKSVHFFHSSPFIKIYGKV